MRIHFLRFLDNTENIFWELFFTVGEGREGKSHFQTK